MKKIIIFTFIFISNSIFTSYNSFQALESSRRKIQEIRLTNSPEQKESSLKNCMLLFETIADLKETQEKEKAELIERKERMRTLIFKGIDLVARLESHGVSKEQAVDSSFQSDDYKELMKIGESFKDAKDFANLILEIQKEEQEKNRKK